MPRPPMPAKRLPTGASDTGMTLFAAVLRPWSLGTLDRDRPRAGSSLSLVPTPLTPLALPRRPPEDVAPGTTALASRRPEWRSPSKIAVVAAAAVVSAAAASTLSSNNPRGRRARRSRGSEHTSEAGSRRRGECCGDGVCVCKNPFPGHSRTRLFDMVPCQIVSQAYAVGTAPKQCTSVRLPLCSHPLGPVPARDAQEFRVDRKVHR